MLKTFFLICFLGPLWSFGLSREAAEKLFERSKESDFPLVLNDKVMNYLNFYFDTQKGRNTVSKALHLMKEYQPMIEGILKEKNLPDELLAVPLVETGYQNRRKDPRKISYGCGIWSFIVSTAKGYGLKVNKDIDQRLNPVLSTRAAARFFKDLHSRFGDWSLALLSYNVGPFRVQQGINKLNSRDAWVLIDQGYENDKDYLAKVMAAIIVVKNKKEFLQ